MLLCRAMHWFNPVMYLISNTIGLFCEIACDESVMSGESEENKKQYCKAILSAACAQSNIQAPAMSTGLCSTKQQLKARMSLILSSNKKRGIAVLCLIITAVTVLSGTVLGYTEAENLAEKVTDAVTDFMPEDFPQVQESTVTNDSTAENVYQTTTTTVEYIPSTVAPDVVENIKQYYTSTTTVTT